MSIQDLTSMQRRKTDQTVAASAGYGSGNPGSPPTVFSANTREPTSPISSSGVISFDLTRKMWAGRVAKQRLSQTGTVIPTP